MDTASFGMSVASLAIQVFGVASDGYSSLRQMNDPRNPLADMVDLQVQQCRFTSWAKATGLSDGRFSQFSEPFTQQTVLNVLCNMLHLLQHAVSHHSRYGIVFQGPGASETNLWQAEQQANNANSPIDGPPGVGDSESALTVTRPDQAQELITSARVSFSAFQRLQWRVSDRRLFQLLIQRLRERNDNLETLLPRPVQISAAEIGETAMLQSDDPKYLRYIARATSKSWTSLAQSAEFKSSYIDSDTNRDAVEHALFIPKTRLALDSSEEESRTLATYENEEPYSGRVLVEWKRVGILKSAMSIEESERVVLDRVKRLVIILACPTDASFRSLACLGYTTSVSGRIGLVFKLPQAASKACPSISLRDLLTRSSRTESIMASSGVGNGKSAKPALENRLKLAHGLALSLYRLHRTGVIHKHITPANIMFFLSKSTSTISILEPYLTGFGFAREESMVDQSENPEGTMGEEELYRHPSSEPGKVSTKAVDIYSLGIILIEIASWEPIKLAKEEKEKAPYGALIELRTFLLSEFVNSGFLAYRMGTDYQNAVKHCLEVSLEYVDQDSATTLGSFYGNVVQGLTPLLS